MEKVVGRAAIFRDDFENEDNGWENVTNTKKDRYLAKKEAKRQAELEQKKLDSPLSSGSSSSAAEAAEEPIADGVNNSHLASKPKKTKKKVASVTINTEEELVAILEKIADGPAGFVQLSVISERLQALTKQPWNKKYKARYGPLKEFMEKRPEFIVNDQKVSVKPKAPEPKPVAAAAAQPASSKKAGKGKAAAAATPAAPAPASKAAASSSAASKPAAPASAAAPSKASKKQLKATVEASEDSGASTLGLFFLLVLVLVAIGTVTYTTLEGIPLAEVPARVQTTFSNVLAAIRERTQQ